MMPEGCRMGKVEDRRGRILRLLSERGQISVRELAESENTSIVTIRKDLTDLEEQRFIRREQGYASLNTDSAMTGRMSVNYEAKCRIAAKAASLVQDRDTVMIESGSSCVLLARELAKSGKHVTVVTNSVFMTGFVRKTGNVSFVLTGGEYLPDSECMTGTLAVRAVRTFHARILFSGTDGFSREQGFTGDSLAKAEVIQAMAEQSDRTVVLAEQAKFRRQGAVSVFPDGSPDAVVTDCEPDAGVRAGLRERGIRILYANS